MNASQRLDEAIDKLEQLTDTFRKVAQDFEDAEQEYDKNFYIGVLKATAGNAEGRKAEAKLLCFDMGLEGRLRAARTLLEAHKEESRNTRTIIDALRSQVANERVGI